jgi:hypothetical protein
MLSQIQNPQALLPAQAGGASRTTFLSRAEAEMMVRVVESVAEFVRGFPLEFHAYCPTDRWMPVLESTNQAIRTIERQLSTDSEVIAVPTGLLLSIVDLEECVSGTRDARLSSGKLALVVSAAGVISQAVLGLPYIATGAYIIALGIALGRPLLAATKDPVNPFLPDTIPPTALNGGCAPSHSMGDHTDKAKVIERVIVSQERKTQRYHWGTVTPASFQGNAAVCLTKGEWRVRVEGWGGDKITLSDGWTFARQDQCFAARNEIAVWEPCSLSPRDTAFGPVPLYSGHEHTIWVEYVGPLTEGTCRRAGPFG